MPYRDTVLSSVCLLSSSQTWFHHRSHWCLNLSWFSALPCERLRDYLHNDWYALLSSTSSPHSSLLPSPYPSLLPSPHSPPHSPLLTPLPTPLSSLPSPLPLLAPPPHSSLLRSVVHIAVFFGSQFDHWCYSFTESAESVDDFPLSFATALFSFLYHLATYEASKYSV